MNLYSKLHSYHDQQSHRPLNRLIVEENKPVPSHKPFELRQNHRPQALPEFGAALRVQDEVDRKVGVVETQEDSLESHQELRFMACDHDVSSDQTAETRRDCVIVCKQAIGVLLSCLLVISIMFLCTNFCNSISVLPHVNSSHFRCF